MEILGFTVFLDSSLLQQVIAGDREAIRSRRRSPAVPILARACFGSGGHGDRGVRWPVYIFPSTLVDLGRVCLVSSSALLLIGGVWFFDFIVGGGDSRVKSKISFWAIY